MIPFRFVLIIDRAGLIGWCVRVFSSAVWHPMLKDTGGAGDVPDLENQSANAHAHAHANNGDQAPGPSAKFSTALDTSNEELSPKKPYLSRTESSLELCRYLNTSVMVTAKPSSLIHPHSIC